MIQTIEEVENVLRPLYKKAYEVTGKDITLERTRKLLALVSNPHERLKVVHVAGTSGKTSTSYYIAALLRSTGASVGLTVSPHIVSLTERLQINGSPLDESEFCSLFEAFLKHLPDDLDATYFEFLIVFVLWVFDKNKLDYVVLETGMGGLHDSTNVCTRTDKVCVITDIGYDHQHILGATLPEIATQKAGIIHEANEVFMHEQPAEVMEVFNKVVGEKQAMLHIASNRPFSFPKHMPHFQRRNWQLAYEAALFVSQRDRLVLSREAAKQTQEVHIPGRMQDIRVDSTRFILDGAHNVQKMQTLLVSLKETIGTKKIPVVIAMKEGKDYEKAIKLLAPHTAIALCAGFQKNQDAPHKSVDPQILASEFAEHEVATQVFRTVTEAVHYAKEMKEPVCLITGSLYILGEAIGEL